jgi:homoserine kinase
VALSGAGPTVIGLVAADTDEAAFALAVEVAERAAEGARALTTRRAPQAVRIDRRGARLL